MNTNVDLSTRARRALSAAALGLLTAAIAVAPASAAPGCDGLAADAEDYENELLCASDASEGEQVITLTESFSISDGANTFYGGSQPLVVQGAHSGVTITGSDVTSESVFLALIGDFGPQSDETAEFEAQIEAPIEVMAASADITVRNLTLTEFLLPIVNLSDSALNISGLTAHNNGFGSNVDTDAPFGGVVTSIGDVTVSSSHFERNEGTYGGVISTYVAFEMGEGSVGNVTVTDSTFVENTAIAGGAVFSMGNTVITGSDFDSNVAETGGAVAAFGPSASVSDSRFTDNAAVALSGEEGYIEGGALAVDGEVAITGTSFTDNTTEGPGGAIAYSQGPFGGASLTIATSVLENNSADLDGSAVWFEGPTSLTDATVTGNEGAVPVVVDGALEITRSTFANNTTADGPSAIAVFGDGDDVTVLNSTFAANSTTSDLPALLVEEAGAVTVEHATFVDNESAGGAADLGVLYSGLTTLTASVWGSQGDVPSCQIDGDLFTGSNFDVDGSCTDGWSGAGDIGDGLDPQLGALADNGGATVTLLPAEESPLVDAVVDGASTAAVDQRGVARPQGDASDIGAVEWARADIAALIEFQVKTDAGIIVGTASPAIAVTGVEWIPTAELETAPPADTMLPYGAAAFTVQVAQPGDSTTITLTAPRPFTTLLTSGDDTWSEVDGATFSNNGTTVTYTLTDGGDLDEDGEANGYIVDPVALAIQGTFTG